jgi:hypothetical protein
LLEINLRGASRDDAFAEWNFIAATIFLNGRAATRVISECRFSGT